MEKAQAMAKKAGVWIDHKQAVVVLITNAGQEIKKIAFDIGQPVRPADGSRPKNKYTPNDFVAEDRRERKVENDRKDYYDDVIASIRGADALVILGPGEAKGELRKHITAKKLRGLTVELETTDKMTDRQLAAKVSEHFTKVPASKSVVPKKTAVRKIANAASRKRTKKSGK
jgi:stalled ribosome rescue protein Dom34